MNPRNSYNPESCAFSGYPILTGKSEAYEITFAIEAKHSDEDKSECQLIIQRLKDRSDKVKPRATGTFDYCLGVLNGMYQNDYTIRYDKNKACPSTKVNDFIKGVEKLIDTFKKDNC